MTNYKKIIRSGWDEKNKVLSTRLSGLVDVRDIIRWIEGFHQAAAEIPEATDFKLLSNLHGFKATDMEAHKAMREIIPRFLSLHGMMPGYSKLFPETPIDVVSTKGQTCIACAHVHHDETKISRYHSELATDYEDFFTDPLKAKRWLAKVPVNNFQTKA